MMDANEPTLFDLPSREPSALRDRSRPGSKGETWTRAVTAKVTITDAQALRDAAARAEKNAVTIGLQADPATNDPHAERANSPFDVLVWLVLPTEGLEDLMEAGAFWVLEVHTEIAPESDDEADLSWTVTVKLTDVPELRHFAVQAHPEKSELIESSLAVAWQYAADPFAPLRPIPGIDWRPTQVVARHIPRRARPSHVGLT